MFLNCIYFPVICFDSFIDIFDWSDTAIAIFLIDFAPRKIVNDQDFPPKLRYPKGEGPPNKSITPSNNHFHIYYNIK